MNKTKLISLLLALSMILAMLAGCGSSSSSDSGSSSDSASSSETATTEASEEAEAVSTDGDTQVLNVAASAFGSDYDVQDMGWRWMMAACYSGLYRNVADEDGEHFVLDGAESVDISDDELVYTFYLRQDNYWSDGVPVTAYDYEYGWKRLLNPEYAYDYASFLFNVVGAEEYYNGEGSADDVMCVALDDYTFQVTLKIADSTFLSKLVATPTFPTREDLAEAAGYDAWMSDWTLHVYNGPFCMSELVEDNKMVWTKNEYYWDSDSVSLETINWYLVNEDSTKSTMFDNGELDVLQTSGDYSIKYQAEAEAGEITVITADYPGTVGLVCDFQNGGLSGLMTNVKIRKALSYAINREEMIEAVYGRYVAAYGYVSPAISFGDTTYRSLVEEPLLAEIAAYQDDYEAIRALFQEGLDELGITTPMSEITITYLSYGSTTETVAQREYLQQIWEQVLGINVELNTVGDYSLYKAERDAGNYDVYSSGWYSDYNDPLDYLYTYYSNVYSGFGGYSNEEYDALIDSLTGETDLDTRLAIYAAAEQFLFDDCAFMPIYYSTKEYFVQNWVQNFCWSSFGASQEFYITYIEGRGY